MSEEQLKAFIEKVQGDDSLQEKLKAAAASDAVVAIAKDVGFTISANDLRNASSITGLSNEELEALAAGKPCWEWSCGKLTCDTWTPGRTCG